MKTAARMFVLAALIAASVSTGFGWGNATHVYIAKQLGPGHGVLAANARYGSILPDAFNFMLDANGAILARSTHFTPMPMMTSARGWSQKAAAWGFLTHNNAWGADFTAHSHGMTYRDTGWVVWQGELLAPSLVSQLSAIIKSGSGGALGDDESMYFAMGLAPVFGHDLVETAVDILIKRNQDPKIGESMADAAAKRTGDVAQLFARAYAGTLASATGVSRANAAELIAGAEAEYQQQMIGYGQAFTAPEAMTIGLLSEMNAAVAKMFIDAAGAQNGVPLDVTVDPAVVTSFINVALLQVKDCYAQELRKTVKFVEHELEEHLRHDHPECLQFPGESIAEGAAFAPESGARALAQNSPNPFNPSTTISFTLPVSGPVTLKVFNAIGQEIALLVDGVQSAGTHVVTWNANTMPSGVYICRLQSGSVSEVRRMLLLK